MSCTRAQRLAQFTRREVTDVLAETLALALPSVATTALPVAVDTLPDAELLALTELQLPEVQDRRLSALLDAQQAGRLSDAERAELAALLQAYNEGLLRKAHALAEALRRGFRTQLAPSS
jgi:hypothetical protein